MRNTKIICILGMARSGTSLTSMILNQIGVYFGPEEHLGEPYIYNQKGSWEHIFIKQINENIFSRFGGDWHNPPTFPFGWENTSELKELKEQARNVIQKDFQGEEAWGYKCPLTCLTLPFWKNLFPSMRYVICLRNPLDVARSLERRDNFSLEKGFYLWLLYTRSAIEQTIGQPRIFLFTEDWVNNWQNGLYALSLFIDKPELANQANIKNSVQSTIDKKLFNSTSREVLTIVHQVYRNFCQEEFVLSSTIGQTLQKDLDKIGAEANKKEAWKTRKEFELWVEGLNAATQELEALISPGDSFILVDEGQWGYDVVRNRLAIPFLERDGQHWGSPSDEETAIRELDRLRKAGAKFIVFGWPAFWWLDYYDVFHRYLRTKFRCVLQNSRLVVFDLRL